MEQWKEVLGKYKYVVLVVLAGVFLMVLPGKNAEPEQEAVTEPSLEQRLEALLSQVEGAGKVRLVLSPGAGEEILFQTDGEETVVLRDQGLVRQVLPGSYQGAVIVCQGADNAALRLALTQALSSATGLKAHEITVLKMK